MSHDPTARAAPPPQASRSGDLGALVDECIVLSDRLVWIAEHIHGERGRGAARRGILRGLVRFGPQTVPELARARSVTRQNVQPVVNGLVREGLIAPEPNPRHRRSPRFGATGEGRSLVAAWDRDDARVLAVMSKGLSRRDLAVAIRMLRAVRERFELTLRWKVALGLDAAR